MTTPCNGRDSDILRYLDDELTDTERKDFHAHLRTCAKCRAQLEEEQALSRLLRQTRPLHSSPAKLRARVSALLSQGSTADPEARRIHRRIGQALARFRLEVLRWLPRWNVRVPAVLTITICLMLAPHVTREVRAASYVDAAVSTHQSYLSGELPLGIRSDSAQIVSAWLTGQLPFAFQLPASQADPGAPAYRLTGAGLLNYHGGKAAVITYTSAQNGKISLLVTSSKYAEVAGGEEVSYRNLTFHYHNQAGFKVITWSNHGLSYALVSSVSGSAQQSCNVCHQNMTDKDSFRSRP